MEKIWIDKKVVQWETQSEGGTTHSLDYLHRTYELWNHANDILLKHKTKDYLSDAISNLNKAIGLRIKMLNENYHFNKSPFKTKDKKIYKQLEEFGIIRPKLLNEITSFRNNIEHNDKTPPSHNKCTDFLEICWYFLKATDLHVLYVKDSFIFRNPTSDNYWISTEIYFDNNWSIYARGWLKPQLVSNVPLEGFIELNSEKVSTRAEFMKTPESKMQIGLDIKDDGRGENPEDISFRGQIIGSKDHLKEIVTKYFRTIV